MRKYVSLAILTITVFTSCHLFACDKKTECDKCAKESELSWNPDNQYVTTRLGRFYSLEEQISAAYTSNNFEKARELAKENLELAAVYRCNWNYGNAIHDTNRILGLISLKNGDIDAASGFLIAAGKSSGSPQLDTFGPELDLANELLKLGKTEPVKIYLNDIKSFWEMNDGKVDAWLAEIEKGGKPELNRFSGKEPGPLLLLIFWLALLWPIIITATFLYKNRKWITRKFLFFISAVVAGYIAMYAGNWFISFVIQKLLTNMEDINESTLFLVAYVPMGLVLLLPALVIFVLGRQFRSNADPIPDVGK